MLGSGTYNLNNDFIDPSILFLDKDLEDDGLYYFNARYYDSTTGRFINVDPIQDGTNWYIYCSNNPLNMIDPTGLEEEAIKTEAPEVDSQSESTTASMFQEKTGEITSAITDKVDGAINSIDNALDTFVDKGQEFLDKNINNNPDFGNTDKVNDSIDQLLYAEDSPVETLTRKGNAATDVIQDNPEMLVGISLMGIGKIADVTGYPLVSKITGYAGGVITVAPVIKAFVETE